MEKLARCNYRSLFAVILCSLALPYSVSATSLVIPTDEDLAVKARLILTAQVLSVDAAFDERQGMVFTYVRLSVKEMFKGRLSSNEIVIKEFGGQVGDRGTLIYGTPTFCRGEEVLLYLSTWQDGSLHVHDLMVGKFSIQREPQTGKAFVRRPACADGVTARRRAGGQVTDDMDLAEYVKKVRKTLRAACARIHRLEKRYDRSLPILECPPEYQAGTKGDDFRPQFTLTSWPFMRWFEPDEGHPVALAVNPDQAPSDYIMEDMALAAAAWSTSPGSSVRVMISEATGECDQDGGPSTIVFNNCDGYFNMDSDVLAFGGVIDFDLTETKLVNGTPYSRVRRAHISFNPHATFSGRCHIQETATHEIGHALGLAHSYGPGYATLGTPEQNEATMYFLIHNDGRCASLRADDIRGINFVYPAGGLDNGGPTFVTEALQAARLGVAYSQAVAATGGSPPYRFGLAPGYPMPEGLGISRKGQISGTPTRAGIYQFTLQVSDAAGRLAMKRYLIELYEGWLANRFDWQKVPNRLKAGEDFFIDLMWQNTGTVTWGEGTTYTVATQNPPDNLTWGRSAVEISVRIPIGGDLQIGFPLKAPTRAGLYNMQWQVKSELEGFFGEPSTNVAIPVDDGSTPFVTGAKYKAKKGKLTVGGERFAEGIRVIVDGYQVSFNYIDTHTLVIKRLNLGPGPHEVQTLGANGADSRPYVFMVN